MKKMLGLFVVIFTCLLGYYIIYNEEYAVGNSIEEIESHLNEYNRKSSNVTIKVERILQIDDSSFWIAQLEFSDNTHGYAELIKGWNNRYKFMGMGSRPILSTRDFMTNKGLFVMIIGQNEDLSIKKIRVIVNGRSDNTHEFDISKEEEFIKFIKVVRPKETSNMTYTIIEKYDKHDNEIKK